MVGSPPSSELDLSFSAHWAGGPWPCVSQVPAQKLIALRPSNKSSQVKVYSSRRQKKTYAEAVGQTGAQGLVRGCGPHCPPVSRKSPARDEASGAPRAGRSSESFSGLISGVRVLSPALSGGRPGFRGRGNPISIDQRPKPRQEG